jgi:hypothetical protein
MSDRKIAVKIVRSCILFVLKFKALEPELLKIDFDSVATVIMQNLLN